MQCNCREELQGKVAEVMQRDLPEGFKDYSASLKNYMLVLSTPVEERLAIPYEGDVMVPKKNGDGYKRQKIETSIQAKYCPFCGKPASPEKGDA